MAEGPILNVHNKDEHEPTRNEELNSLPIIMYTSEDGSTQLEVKLNKETVWLTIEQMALLFGRDRTVVTKHINNIFKEGELEKKLGKCKICTYQELWS